MKEQYIRTAMLLGEAGIENLLKKRVAIFGLGGVGGYAAEALAFYRDDERVMHINGSVFGLCETSFKESAFFYRYAHIWGWASWRRAWKYYDVDMKNFDPETLYKIFPDDLLDTNKVTHEFA